MEEWLFIVFLVLPLVDYITTPDSVTVNCVSGYWADTGEIWKTSIVWQEMMIKKLIWLHTYVLNTLKGSQLKLLECVLMAIVSGS